MTDAQFRGCESLQAVLDRVFVLCGNRLLRESIVRILAKKTDFEVTSCSEVGGVLLKDIKETTTIVLVSDSLQLVLEDCKSAENVSGNEGQIRPILVAMEDSPEGFFTAVRNGVWAYVFKDASAAEVVSAIRAVAKGEAICPPQYTKVLFDALASKAAGSDLTPSSTQFRLTRREEQLIPLVNRGWTNKEIANHLNLSEQTIKTHIHRILHKVGAPDRQSLFRVRVEQNICGDPPQLKTIATLVGISSATSLLEASASLLLPAAVEKVAHRG